MRALVLLLLSAAAAGAAERSFKEIVSAISDHYGRRPTRIPLFGLVNAFAFVARPAGASHIDLAVFENLNGRGMDAEVVDRIVGNGWKPFIRVVSRRKGAPETTLIYMRNEGKDMRLLLTNIERNEATVLQLKVNTEGFRRWVDDPSRTDFGQ